MIEIAPLIEIAPFHGTCIGIYWLIVGLYSLTIGNYWLRLSKSWHMSYRLNIG